MCSIVIYFKKFNFFLNCFNSFVRLLQEVFRTLMGSKPTMMLVDGGGGGLSARGKRPSRVLVGDTEQQMPPFAMQEDGGGEDEQQIWLLPVRRTRSSSPLRRVVSNSGATRGFDDFGASFGGSGGQDYYDESVNAWR